MSKKESKKKKHKKAMSDNKRIAIFITIIVVVLGLVGVSCYMLLKPETKPGLDDLKKNTNSIDGYGITVDDLDSKLYKDEYNALKKNLTSGNINEDEYAASVARMFLIDLYTIDTKVNKYDVGGVDFVYPEIKENYITNVTDTIYNYVEDNSDNKRTQKLPQVESLDVLSSDNIKYEIKSEEKEYDAYKFKIQINYIEDLKYDTKAEVIVIKKDGFMYVVEKN